MSGIPSIRMGMDEDALRKVIKYYPRTRWAAFAAFDLIDNKLCGDWQGSTQCPEKEADIYLKYADEYPDGPRTAQALYEAVYRIAVLKDMYDASGDDQEEQRRAQPGSHRGRAAESPFRRLRLLPWEQARWCTNWMKAFLSTVSNGIEPLTVSRREPGDVLKRQPGGFLSPYILSILLGIVEGLTEFLPVSSTAHLRIAEALMKIPLGDSACSVGNAACLQDVAYWNMYTIVIQVGAILALCLLFLERIVNFLRTFPRGESGDRTWLNHPISLTLIAFACTSVPALLLRKWSEKNLGSLNAMAIALLVGGIVMWIIDAWSRSP